MSRMLSQAQNETSPPRKELILGTHAIEAAQRLIFSPGDFGKGVSVRRMKAGPLVTPPSVWMWTSPPISPLRVPLRASVLCRNRRRSIRPGTHSPAPEPHRECPSATRPQTIIPHTHSARCQISLCCPPAGLTMIRSIYFRCGATPLTHPFPLHRWNTASPMNPQRPIRSSRSAAWWV